MPDKPTHRRGPAVIIDPQKLGRHLDAGAVEAKWQRVWHVDGVYRYDPTRGRDETFVVDTPPPTVSGSLHIGHVFSYTHTDICVRYRRMRGRNVYYPMGWDDNGLPTERRVQNYYHVTCDPDLPYAGGLVLEAADDRRRKEPARAVSRKDFIELCHRLTREDEEAFRRLWEHTGLSVDWREQYATIDDTSRRYAQLSFLDLYRKGHVYNRHSPTMWDVDFRTAVAQAEVEDRPTRGVYHRIRFGVRDTDRSFVVATTRPELLPACVGVAAHPEDTRYRDLFGRTAVTPLFHAPVPVFASPLADPEKGTGILMVCTFGDSLDVEWWQSQGLPLRQIIGMDGRLQSVVFGSPGWDCLDAPSANAMYTRLAGRTTEAARREIVTLLREGPRPALVAEPEPVEHPVRFYEKGDRPLELIPTRQWFVRLLDRKDTLIEMGRRITWHPAHMGLRYANWTENLMMDWCISRQRFFGVAFPIWYPLDGEGRPRHDAPILAPEDRLPVDPMTDVPPGYRDEQRGRPGGFVGEKDVFDTWFTSSLTPQISSRWILDPARHARLFPADIRAQSHDIIRTWAFYTIAKSMLHHGVLPWSHVLVSGFIMDPDRKKMSKSKGNVVTPEEYLARYTADGVRYWAAGVRLGVDTAFDESVMRNGRRLVVKLYNAGKFVLSLPRPPGQVTEPLDRAFLRLLRGLAREATQQYERYEFALTETEAFFWHRFTDTYLELAKTRARDGAPQASGSAVAALRMGLGVLLRLFAPILPYITEEIWSWAYARETGEPSIHRSPWPADTEWDGLDLPADAGCFEAAVSALSEINKAKTLAGVSVARGVAHLKLVGSAEAHRALQPVATDVMSAGRVAGWDTRIEEGAAGWSVRDAVFAEVTPERPPQS